MATTGDRRDEIAVTKVRAGFYRVGKFCIHRGHRWNVFIGFRFVKAFGTLTAATTWSQLNQTATGQNDDRTAGKPEGGVS